MTSRIPRIVHFVFGLRPQDEPFHLVHYLAIASCRAVVQPDEIVVHHHELPYGLYWDLARPLVTLNRVDRVRAVTEFAYDDPVVARYSYAHEADFVRLDALAEHGGMYADIDTAFVAPPPVALWDAPAVIGREPDVCDPRTGAARSSLSNALIMAAPGSDYIRRWRDEIAGALDGSWCAHSCFLADDLARAHPAAVRVEPQRRFHAFGPSPEGLRALLVDPPPPLDGVASVHLAAHLWWDEERRDFSDVHARMITERWVRTSPSTYAALVRAHLPSHHRFPVRTGTVRQLPPAARRVRGRPAALRYVAEDAASGYGDAADRLVRALRVGGVGVEYRGWSNTFRGEDPAFVPYSRDDRPNDRVTADDAPTVAHLVPEYYPLVRDVLDVRGERSPLVAHTVWETDRIPAPWPELLNAVDRVIVPSEWNRDVFAAGGVRTPIAVVPHVVCDPATPSREAVAALGVPDDVVVFYTIGRWDERKAVFHAVRAFLEAFTADDPVVLVVKTGTRIEMPPAEGWGAGNPLVWTTGWQVAQIVRRYRRPAPVRVEVETWTDDRVAALHTRGDCYVGLARGEGWGMGAFDACAYGNPVIATGWGGYLEYLTSDAAFLVDHELVHVQHHAEAYSPDQRWAEPSIEHAVAQLRTVAGDLDRARRRAAPLQQRVRTEFAPNEVARRFLHAVQ